jgi:hypothetical protein
LAAVQSKSRLTQKRCSVNSAPDSYQRTVEEWNCDENQRCYASRSRAGCKTEDGKIIDVVKDVDGEFLPGSLSSK